MDSLRYWVEVMHVDGFRFDLTSALARDPYVFDYGSGFLDAVRQDPVLSRVKLIAEPWDLGDGGYQVGGFPPGWSEWNGKFRDTTRRYWKGEAGQIQELAARVTGSADMLAQQGRRPSATVNFITAHDGFTLHDLVSFNDKHNEANGEDNRDGINENDSWNCGVEGETDDPEVLKLRARQKRNLLATLLLSQGVPMLLAGDEMGNTQRGNNNAYCQDNEIAWIKWDRGRPLPDGVRADADAAAPQPPGVPPAPLLPRAADPRDRRQGYRLAQPGGARAARRRLALPGSPLPGLLSGWRRRRAVLFDRRPAGARRRLRRADERLPRADPFTLPPAAGPPLGGVARYGAARAPPASRYDAASTLSARAALAGGADPPRVAQGHGEGRGAHGAGCRLHRMPRWPAPRVDPCAQPASTRCWSTGSISRTLA